MNNCPLCGREVDLSRNLSGKIPVEGDTNICYKCGGYLTYGNNGQWRAYSKEECRRLKADDPATFAFLEERKKQMQAV
jgi:hypothetical protein